MSIESATQETGEQTEVIDRSERKKAVILRFTARAKEICDNWIAAHRPVRELMRSIIDLYEEWLEEYKKWLPEEEWLAEFKEWLPEKEEWMERDNNFTRALREVGYRINRYETEQRQEHESVSVPALEKPTSKTQRVFLQIMALTGVSRVSIRHYPPSLKQ